MWSIDHAYHSFVTNIAFAFQAAAELEKRKENFTKELDFVCADVVCYIFLFIYCLTLFETPLFSPEIVCYIQIIFYNNHMFVIV